jgi:hypothetical protein
MWFLQLIIDVRLGLVYFISREHVRTSYSFEASDVMQLARAIRKYILAIICSWKNTSDN